MPRREFQYSNAWQILQSLLHFVRDMKVVFAQINFFHKTIFAKQADPLVEAVIGQRIFLQRQELKRCIFRQGAYDLYTCVNI